MVKLTLFDIIKRPRISSKAVHLNQQKQAQLVIDVHIAANKPQIKAAVQALFGVKVDSVNTLIVAGKRRRSGGRYISEGSSYKKAIVTLQKGQEIADFNGIEQQAEVSEKAYVDVEGVKK